MEVYFSQRPQGKKTNGGLQHTPNRITDRKLDHPQASSEPDPSHAALRMPS
jgi:hypothetical protein